MAAVVRRPVATPPSLGPPRSRPRHASVITIETAPASFGLATRATSLPDRPNPNPAFNTIDNNDTQFAVVYQRSVRGDVSSHTSSYNTDAELRCLICFEPKPFASRTTPRCTHEPRVCDDCLARHVQISVCDRGFTNVTCPVLSCREVLQYEDFRAVVKDQEVFARYERLLLRRTLDKVPNFVWCKNPACSSGQIHDQDSLCPTVRCKACKAESCFEHDVPWHTGLTCVEYEIKMKHSAQASKYRASENYISKNTKACPNCKRMIEKAHGCDHMTCMEPMGCGHEFCWCCLADYKRIHEQGNHYHKRRCRHYDSRLKLALKRALVWILRL